MSALVERIIAARDALKGLNISDYALIRQARDAMADAANALTERDETIHAQRQRLAKVEAFSSVELMNCARYVNDAGNAIEGADRGRELARMVLRLSPQGPAPVDVELAREDRRVNEPIPPQTTGEGR